MDRRLNKKVNDHFVDFKTKLSEKIKGVKFDSSEEQSDLLNYLFAFEKFEFSKEDFMKRKRVKNVVPVYDLCIAKRATGEQCTRRKKDGCSYCGTHIKGTPHGIMTDLPLENNTQKVEVSAIEIKGIVYYCDNKGNVYDTEDILSNTINPKIIAKYEKNGEEYSIPSLFNT
jgi:hypothetical protein